MEVDKKAYGKYVEEITPKHNLPVNMLRAFLTGGVICTAGQLLNHVFQAQGIEEEAAGSWTLLVLIGASAFFTGLNLYQKLVKFGGAGALVPITGFANSVAAPAIEYKAEGQVFGIGCKIFTISGPVILYGLLSSWLLGFICWLGKIAGIS